jgi:hypothetical protein
LDRAAAALQRQGGKGKGKGRGQDSDDEFDEYGEDDKGEQDPFSALLAAGPGRAGGMGGLGVAGLSDNRKRRRAPDASMDLSTGPGGTYTLYVLNPPSLYDTHLLNPLIKPTCSILTHLRYTHAHRGRCWGRG